MNKRKIAVLLLWCGVLVLSGCHLDDSFGNKKEPLPEENDKFNFLKNQKPIDAPSRDGDNDSEEIVIAKLTRDVPAFKSFIDGQEPLRPGHLHATSSSEPELEGRATPRFYDDLILLNADEKVKVGIAFNSAPLIDTLPIFADILGFDYIADSEIRSVVSVNFNSNMTRRELWEAFDQILYLAGVGVVKSGYTLRIMPLSKMPAQNDIVTISRGDGTSQVLYYPVKNNLLWELNNQIRPFLGQGSVIIPLYRQNALIISDHAANIPKLKQLLDVIDQEYKSGRARALIHCENIMPTKMVAELGTIMPVLGFPVLVGGSGNEQPGMIHLTGVDRLQVILATAANEEAIRELQKWVTILDNSMDDEQEKAFIYKVSCGKANELTQALAAIFNITAQVTNVNITSAGSSVLSTSTVTGAAPRQAQAMGNNLAAISNAMPNSTVDRNSNVFEAPIRIYSDGVHNRLLIRTTPRVYAVVRAVLEKLDVVPAQVLLQVMIMEVSLTDTTQFGLEFSYSTADGNMGSISSLNYSSVVPTGVPVNTEGGSFAIFNPADPSQKFAQIKALAGNNNIKIISSPQILVTSNTQAVINVGQSVPVLTATSGSTINPDTVSNQVSNKDAGITFTVIPQVTSTNLISLDLEQVISKAAKNTYTSLDSPQFDNRSIKTNMIIGNGKTMIIGGMIQEEFTDNLRTLPFIGNIPFLRRLFGDTDYTARRVELLVLITGYIVNESSPLEDMIRRYNESVREINAFEARLAKAHSDDMQAAEKARKLLESELPSEVIKRDNELQVLADNQVLPTTPFIEEESREDAIEESGVVGLVEAADSMEPTQAEESEPDQENKAKD